MAAVHQVRRLILRQVKSYLHERQRLLYPSISYARFYSSRPTLSVLPKSGLADELLDIRVCGLTPGQFVTLQAQVDSECKRFRFESDVIYQADSNGDVSVGTHFSLGGSYKGIEPMGLIWSVAPEQSMIHKNPRLIKFNVTEPFNYTINVFSKAGNIENSVEKGKLLASSQVERSCLPDYVDTISVKCGSAEGNLFLPHKRAKSDPLPFIIDMGGLGPRAPMERPPLLASHGFAVFAFDYFASLKDAIYSNTESDIHFSCALFHDIIEFVKQHPRLDASRIGIYGACYGGCLALHAVSRLDLPIKCMALARIIDTLCIYVGLKMPDGTLVAPAGPVDDYIDVETTDGGSKWFRIIFDHDIFESTNDESFVAPIENVSCPLLFLVCGDDQQSPSAKRMTMMADRLDKAGKGYLLDFTFLEGAGHLLETPYLPLCTQSTIFMRYPDKLLTNWGGEPALHARAQVTAWRKTINFFRTHLAQTEMYRTDWLSDS